MFCSSECKWTEHFLFFVLVEEALCSAEQVFSLVCDTVAEQYQVPFFFNFLIRVNSTLYWCVFLTWCACLETYLWITYPLYIVSNYTCNRTMCGSLCLTFFFKFHTNSHMNSVWTYPGLCQISRQHSRTECLSLCAVEFTSVWLPSIYRLQSKSENSFTLYSQVILCIKLTAE